MKRLGKQKKTQRGFRVVEFSDLYRVKCSIQQSSLASQPALWLGVDDPEPKVMKMEAHLFGLQPDPPIEGWMPYPIPKQVLLSTRMHLSREMATALIGHLQRWLKDESFA